jgi:hypothetical protein
MGRDITLIASPHIDGRYLAEHAEHAEEEK